MNENETLLNDVECKYISHLLGYAENELFVYSSIFLREHGIQLEDVNSFIANLKTKIENMEVRKNTDTKLYLCNGYNDSCGHESNGKGMCRPANCYLCGGECKHTINKKFAKNPQEKQKFVMQEDGYLWEVE